VLGMRAEGHGDPQTEAHPQTLFLTNLHPKMKVTAHLHLFCRIRSATRSPSKSGRSLQRSQGGGGPVSEVNLAPKVRRRRRGRVGGLPDGWRGRADTHHIPIHGAQKYL
jgi:hypothetical protein